MRYMNLLPEINHIVQKANDKISDLEEDEITEKYTEYLANSIKINIIEKYRLDQRDIKFLEKHLEKQKPDYYLIGLAGKDVDEDRYSKNLQFLLVQINNSYVSNCRNNRAPFWSLIISIASVIISMTSAIISLIINIS